MKRLHSEAANGTPADTADMTERRTAILSRLEEINGVAVPAGFASAVVKTELHWDHVMQEMGWLAADFQKERERHRANAKKISKAVDLFHKSKESKKIKKAKDEIISLKKTSSKIARDVRKFWLKINKVIAFRQKGEADDVRQKAMDKHLVFLVKQTERYTNMLTNNLKSGGEIGLEFGESEGKKRNKNESSRSSNGKKYERAGTDTSIECIDDDEDDDAMDVDEEHSCEEHSSVAEDHSSEASSYSGRRKSRNSAVSFASSSSATATVTSVDENCDGESARRNVVSSSQSSNTASGRKSAHSDRNRSNKPKQLSSARKNKKRGRSRKENDSCSDSDGDSDVRGDNDSDGEKEEEEDEEMKKNVRNIAHKCASNSSSSTRIAVVNSKKNRRHQNEEDDDNNDDDEGENDDNDDEDDDGDFEGDDEDEEEEEDDSTLIEEERLRLLDMQANHDTTNSTSEGEGVGVKEVYVSREEELCALRKEGDTPIEELRAMYANMQNMQSEEEEDDEEVEEEEEEGEETEKIQKKNGHKQSSSSSSSSSNTKSAKDKIKKNRRHQNEEEDDDNDDDDEGENDDNDDEDDDGDFEGDDEDEEEEEDDSTLIEEERLRLLDMQANHDTTNSTSEGEGVGVKEVYVSREEELCALRKEGDMPIEELRAMYANMQNMQSEEEEEEEEAEEEEEEGEETEKIQKKNGHKQSSSSSSRSSNTKSAKDKIKKNRRHQNEEDDDHNDDDEGENDDNDDEDDDGDFEGDDEDEEDEEDDSTLIEEERLRLLDMQANHDTTNSTSEGEGVGVKEVYVSREEELCALRKEGDTPIEELRAMYANMQNMQSEEEEDDEEEEEEEVEGEGEGEGEGGDEETKNKSVEEDENLRDDSKLKEKKKEENTDTAGIEKLMDEEVRKSFISMSETLGSAHETGLSSEVLKGDNEDLHTLEVNSCSSRANSSDVKAVTHEGKKGVGNVSSIGISGTEMDALKVEGNKNENDAVRDVYNVDTKMDICEDEIDDRNNEEDSKDKEHSEDKECSQEVLGSLKRLEVADEAARSVHVERPFVLSRKLQLREYQHVGLNWLVSLHERRLNGILADEMGLGKTVQTISLLAYLAAYRGIWGPHLIVVPTSCLVNWETEFKKWCPIFKVLTYYGSAKARKLLRTGWSKLNSFHICITSYQLVVQDAQSFRRKRWYYMALDEAHNIKNFKSQRWQTLLNFNTQRRLLLTGTPLQNNLMELWSLMHFLMPHIFRSRKEFSYWFSNPLSSMVEGNRGINNDLISRLHSIMRPFLLRRLKKDVEKQLPGKVEHIVMCKLSKRQQFLYEEFMSRSSTKSLLSGANYMGMMNILMQLRKVCNHPDLFEPRPITSPFVDSGIRYSPGRLVTTAMTVNPLCLLSDHMKNFWAYHYDQNSRDEMMRLSPTYSQVVTVTIEDLNMGKNNEIPSIFESRTKRFGGVVPTETVSTPSATNNESSTKSVIVGGAAIAFNWRIVNAVTISLPIEQSMKARYDNRINRRTPSVWKHLVKSAEDRSRDFLEVIQQFVFVMPKASGPGPYLTNRGNKTEITIRESVCSQMKNRINNALAPYYNAKIRQEIFFPDRKLVQFDSGKLQSLSRLLHEKKSGGHKCLIFTQMSKMLDILEVFLNLHAHTYVRLDGSTSIERRQRLMDRFNSDPKLFCFILSTRSGGLGINLTGADTVIFYDSDWNPAMDAQAQDRAHRIGQTREVHIYRFVCSSTIEENILTKAKQKRHLDFLVMTEGNFSETSLFSAQGLKDVLGAETNNAVANTEGTVLLENKSKNENGEEGDGRGGNAEVASNKVFDIEAAMAAAEDEDDVCAMKHARAEQEQDAEDFDENENENENAAHTVGDDDDDNEKEKDKEKDKPKDKSNSSKSASTSLIVSSAPDVLTEEKDMELEFASWQANLGPDFSALESALKPVERFALKLRTDIEPYYSIFYSAEKQRLAEMGSSEVQEKEEMWNVEEIEREKEEEEYRALAEGELLATNLTRKEVNKLQPWYKSERLRRNRERRRRVLTGAGWNQIIDPLTFVPFWYNDDTGEACYARPKIIEERENLETALERGFVAIPLKTMITVLSFLLPYPDRTRAARVCSRWYDAASDNSFHLRVLSVESGARIQVESGILVLGPRTYISISDALKSSLPGDTICLCVGHHWESGLVPSSPVRLISESDDPSRCVVEIGGQLSVKGNENAMVIVGVTFRHPRKVQGPSSCVSVTGARVMMLNCILNNDGASGPTVHVHSGASVKIFGSTISGGEKGGILVEENSSFVAAHTKIHHNPGNGLEIVKSEAFLEDCIITKNGKNAFSVFDPFSRLYISHCNVAGNEGGTYTEYTGITVNEKSVLTEIGSSDIGNTNGSGNEREVTVEKQEYHSEKKIQNLNSTGIETCSASENIPSTALPEMKERMFFAKKCVGDEEAVLTFEKYSWKDCSDDVLEDEEEDSSEVSVSVVPKNNSKEASVKNVSQNRNSTSDVPNTLKRKRKSDSSGKNMQKELNSTSLTNKSQPNDNLIKGNKKHEDIIIDSVGNFNFEFDGQDYDKMEILIKQEKFEMDDEQNDENYFGDLISTKIEKFE